MNSNIEAVIPVYNPDDKFDQLLKRLYSQTMPLKKVHLIHTVTSHTQNLDRFLEQYGDWIDYKAITPNEFDHGGTTNEGASYVKSEFILFMTQDAVPNDNHLIRNLHRVMETPDIAVSYARQLVDQDANILEQYVRNFNYPDQSKIKSKKDLAELGIKTYFCSNVCSLYRKSVYKKAGGFVTQTIFNEDMIMASYIIELGYRIAYVAEATVVHWHDYTLAQQFTRNFDLAVSQAQYHEIFDQVSSESEGIKMVKEVSSYLLRQGKPWLICNL